MKLTLGLLSFAFLSVGIFFILQYEMYHKGAFTSDTLTTDVIATIVTITSFTIIILILKKWGKNIYWFACIGFTVLNGLYFIMYPLCIIAKQCDLPNQVAVTLILDYLCMIFMILSYHLMAGERRMEQIFLLIIGSFVAEAQIYLDNDRIVTRPTKKLWKVIIIAIFLVMNILLMVTLKLMGEQSTNGAYTLSGAINFPYFVIITIVGLAIVFSLARHIETISKITSFTICQKWLCYFLVLLLGNVNGGVAILSAMILGYH